jgi:hypothetical protein
MSLYIKDAKNSPKTLRCDKGKKNISWKKALSITSGTKKSGYPQIFLNLYKYQFTKD